MIEDKETLTLHPRAPSFIGGPAFPLLTLLLCLSLFFIGLGAYSLYDPDEGRNAEVAREIAKEGHWLPPTLNGQVRYQKPPLYYWLVAGSFKIWGIREFAARLPSALAAIMGVLATMVLGKKFWGKEGGLWAGIILATSFIYAIYAHIVISDMVLTLFITWAIVLFWLGLTQKDKSLLRLSALSAALAFLTKGPIGVLIPAMVLLPPLIYQIRRGERPSIPWLSMLVVFLAVTLPVYILAELKYPGYCHRFFWEENVIRYLTPKFHREGPLYYYVIVVLVGLFPWTWLLKEIPGSLKELRHTHTEEIILLGSWIFLPLLFFTLSKSKLPHYILPTFPAWALLLAGSWTTKPGLISQRGLYKILGITLILYLSALLLVAPSLARYHSAAPVLDSARLESEIPLVAYKATKFSLAFYTGKPIKIVEKKSVLRRTVKDHSSLYIFIKRKRLKGVSYMAKRAGKRVQVIGRSPRYFLLAIEKNKSEKKAPFQR